AQYVGRILKVAEPVVYGIGKAKVGDGLWRISCDETLNLAEGARVRVVGVEGATLKVEHVKD
ncbi:MAG: NfeD family protein, partial [Pseudomonadota bacterium]|nr:NfeD family protein [Pseudomonadota bacterium]